MSVVNEMSGTRVDEIAAGIFRVSTPIPPSVIPGGFTFNQFLVVDDQPLLFHTGPRRLFPMVREGIAHVLGDVARLRYVAFSHVEADECGSLNEWLACAPHAAPVCGRVAAMVSVADLADRPPVALADGEDLGLGTRRLRWLDAAHVPHNWECGYLFEVGTRTLLCGDLLSQGGSAGPPLTESDVLEPAEAMRAMMDYSSRSPETRSILEKLAQAGPTTLAIMHGSSYRGDGASVLRALAGRLVTPIT